MLLEPPQPWRAHCLESARSALLLRPSVVGHLATALGVLDPQLEGDVFFRKALLHDPYQPCGAVIGLRRLFGRDGRAEIRQQLEADERYAERGVASGERRERHAE